MKVVVTLELTKSREGREKHTNKEEREEVDLEGEEKAGGYLFTSTRDRWG